MLVVAFYTIDTPYEQEIKNLEASLIKLGLRYKFRGYDSRASWVENAGIKPEFLLDMLLSQDDDILYVDADAIVRSNPVLLHDITEDIALHYKDGKELLSGTIFLRNNSKVKHLLQLWIQEQMDNPKIWDQKILDKVLKENKDIVSLYKLPASYTKIFDSMKEEAVIEHFQASRRFRNMINNKKKTTKNIGTVPDIIDGMRVRKVIDGSFFIPRCPKDLEKVLDAKYVRIKNEFRWYPYCDEGDKLETMRPVIDGNIVYIIGKGPSLDNVSISDFKHPDAPVICINESIHKIEELGLPNPVFCLQQDMSLKDDCRPKKAKLIVAHSARHWYTDYSNKIIFYIDELGTTSCLSVEAAIRIGKKFNAKEFKLLCFDAYVNENTAYADCIGYEPTRSGKADRFLKHKAIIDKDLEGQIAEFITPMRVLQNSYDTSVGIPRQLPDSQQEHHDDLSAQPPVC